MGTFKCCESLTTELFSVGFIVGLTYIAEKHWYAPHMGKTYSPDFFAFITLVFFALAIYTRKPVTDLALLGRQQSEEWKGWMQYIFLMYHYFHAEDVYNAVRVMITCYVWMTGFGNFSFFYVKRDFGWLRILQMLWRLNFSVLFLMFAHNNTYILYFICPLHTFYFLMVFVCMWIMSDLNHSKWGIRTKLLALGCLIYIIWDVNGGLFNYLFFFAGTEPKVGANGGTLWEWYFRSSLDHWSAFFGMIFALNFPACEAFFKNAVEEGKTGALWVVGAVLSVLSAWWCLSKHPAGKIEYNQTHAYLAFIPLLSYVFFRNITPGVRSAVSESLHDLGKTTLETYLLQHHIWLSSNAKTLLNIVPGMPYVNFFVATTFFVLFSKELYRVSLSLRGMFLPDDAVIKAPSLSY